MEALAVVEKRVGTVGKPGTLFIWTIVLLTYTKALKVQSKDFT